MEGIKVITSDFVNIFITKANVANDAPVERRFKKNITILDFKTKLELVTGGSAATMKLNVYDNKNNLICALDNNDRLLGSYPIDDGMKIEVVDKFDLLQGLGSTESEERFRLSEEEYQKKNDTVRSFLLRNKLGKYNEEEMAKIKEQQQKEIEEEARLLESVLVGSRCEVKVPNQPVRRASVKFTGQLDGAKGYWVGVQYDEPLGKNDGSVNEKRYFTCPPKYGGFVKPAYVTIGDFPEYDDGLDDEI